MTTSIRSNFSSIEMPLVGSSSSSSARRAGDRHGDVEQLAHALRQRDRERVAVSADRGTGRATLRPPRRRRGERSGVQHVAQDMPFEHGAIAAATHMLSNTVSEGKICATWNEREMPSRVIVARRQAGDVAVLEPDRAVGRPQVAGDHVDEGGLAGAVGADHADRLLRRHARP